MGAIRLSSTSPVWIAGLRTVPKLDGRRVAVTVTIGNASGRSGDGTITLSVHGPGLAATPIRVAVHWDASGGTILAECTLGPDPRLWDEFDPVVYRLEAVLTGTQANDRRTTSFGLREIANIGTRFTINGRPTFLRGTLECCIFPRTGHPPTEVTEWRRIIAVAKAHGLNHLRFHSWCPPEAAFQAADELGFLCQVECGAWTEVGSGKPQDAWLHDEARRIVATYGNHPSFAFLVHGNEPSGSRSAAYLADFVTSKKAEDQRHLHSSGAGWPEVPQNQFHVVPGPRIQQWAQGLGSRINAQPPETASDYRDFIAQRTVPVVSHEIGQWCAYPDFAGMAKYTGHLRPRNFEIFRDLLEQAGMLNQARDFLQASGRLQTLCYKEEIESALRTPGMGGFQLLDLHDFPGQGSALVGVLDPFWEEKGYVTPVEYRRFCNHTVPLARLKKRVFTADETLCATVEVAHFGPRPLTGIIINWRLVDQRCEVLAEGRLPACDIPLGNGIPLGEIAIPLAALATPSAGKLVVSLEGTPYENDWSVWIYPAKIDSKVPPGVHLSERLDNQAATVLAHGGTVLWTIPPDRVRQPADGTIALGFSTIFWNTAWTQRQPPHTLGILCDPDHPLFERFPTDAWSNWQWWYLVHAAAPLVCDGLPRDLRPVVQVIDDWTTCHRLGLVVEARIGNGRLLVTSVPISDPLDPVTRQFRHALLMYAGSVQFAPTTALNIDQARTLIDETLDNRNIPQ